jgi:hypothetical protein
VASLLKNTANQNITFTLVNATTGAALTTATFTSLAWVTNDNVQAGFAGTFTTLGNGQFNYAPTQAETNCTDFGLLITVSGAVPVNFDFHTDTSVPLTGPQIATAVWQDTTSGDFTTAASIGKALYVNAVPGAAGGHFIAGPNAATTVNITGNLSGTVGSVTGAVGSVTGNVGGSVASVTGAVGSVTGNVGGNVVGSVASVTGAVGSVTGNVGGNVVGSVASVVAAVIANMTQINGSTIAAAQLALSTQSICSGTIGSGSTTTSFVTSALVNPASLTDTNQLVGRTIIFLGIAGNSGHVQAQATNITASSTGSTPTISSTNPLTTAPSSGDLFVVL